MGLLRALDYHKSPSFRLGKGVEYQLYSWGEIGPPFLGDREHSMRARCILCKFPFRLFSSSTPGNGQWPHKLCLTFKTSYEVRGEDTRGFYSDETAKEFAAFLSLVTRRRVFASKLIRSDGLPVEEEVHLYQRSHFQERQGSKEIEPEQIYLLLENLRTMDRRIADIFILATRLYHSAVAMMYTDPEFSYLFLIACLEAISSAVYKGYRPNEDGFLESRYPKLKAKLNNVPEKEREGLRKEVLRNEKFILIKFSKFVSENVPECFWSETEDNAKPDYLTVIFERGPNGSGQETISHSDITIQNKERIEREGLEAALKNIYDARSRLIHQGIRLPANIVIGLFRRISPQMFFEMTQSPPKDQRKLTKPIPPLLTFERLVSYSMTEFLHKQQSRRGH